MLNPLEHLTNVLSSKKFLNKQGLGNELPFFIFPYDPKDELEIKVMLPRLIKKLGEAKINTLQIDLYDLSIEIIEKRGIWENVLNSEGEISKAELKELLQGVLDTENHLIPAIKKKMNQSQFDILLITGIGEVFPYIRSHNVLNNLQSTAKEQPTVMFFPGKYEHSLEDGASLQLFGRLQDDKYYRAFNIYHYEV
tara:strand:- start:1327 stop:1911 length:585 start_codon:yes stop_codon:yes gene_type:complete